MNWLQEAFLEPTMVQAVIATSIGKSIVTMEKAVQAATDSLRSFMFDHVYIGSLAKIEEGKVAKVIGDIFQYYMEQPTKMPEEYLKNVAGSHGLED